MMVRVLREIHSPLHFDHWMMPVFSSLVAAAKFDIKDGYLFIHLVHAIELNSRSFKASKRTQKSP